VPIRASKVGILVFAACTLVYQAELLTFVPQVKITKLFLDKSRETILQRRQEGRTAALARKTARKSASAVDPMWNEYQEKLQAILSGQA
jgi:hypothetical protein